MIRKTLLALTASALTLSPLSASADVFTLDAGHSAVLFKAKHFGVGYTYGRFNKISGTYTSGAAPTVSFEVDASSVDSANAKRDDHLKGPDFFNVNETPKITFKSTRWEDKGGGSALVTGDLSLHGVTKSVTVTVIKVGEGSDPYGGYRAGFETTFTIKRSDFGISYGLPAAVSDEITLIVSFEGVRGK
jgi:polyisoprenoid-binding protein YceI